jgi:hypothetical protein
MTPFRWHVQGELVRLKSRFRDDHRVRPARRRCTRTSPINAHRAGQAAGAGSHRPLTCRRTRSARGKPPVLCRRT